MITVVLSVSTNFIRDQEIKCRYVCFFYLIHHFKVQAQSCGRVEIAHFPLTCSTDTHLLRRKDRFYGEILITATRWKGRWIWGEDSQSLKRRDPWSWVKHMVRWPRTLSVLLMSVHTKMHTVNSTHKSADVRFSSHVQIYCALWEEFQYVKPNRYFSF